MLWNNHQDGCGDVSSKPYTSTTDGMVVVLNTWPGYSVKPLLLTVFIIVDYFAKPKWKKSLFFNMKTSFWNIKMHILNL